MDECINVTRAVLPEMDEYIDEIKSIWTNHWLTNMGEKHNELKEILKEFLEVDNLDLLVNGHMALELAMQALNLTGEIITTPFTFASTTHAIVRNNLTPVFCDIKADDFTIDVSKIEALVTDKTSAIVPVHVYGNICDIDGIQSIADKYGLKVIYDAAHAFGEKRNGINVASFGDASCFSFHATKVFNTIEGGAVSFKSKETGERLYKLKNFGIKNEDTVDGIGANAKMNEFCAAMGICNMRHLKETISKRKKLTEEYNIRLCDTPGIRINRIESEVESNYSYYPIVIDEKEFGFTRNEVIDELKKENIVARKYFYPLTSSFECYNRRFNELKTPIALWISKRVITLPLYPDLTVSEVDKICNVIIKMRRESII